jgi:hypothetical protein
MTSSSERICPCCRRFKRPDARTCDACSGCLPQYATGIGTVWESSGACPRAQALGRPQRIRDATTGET